MWTAREATARLREELGFSRLQVVLQHCRPEDKHFPHRWAVLVLVPRWTGARNWPVTLLDDGTVLHGGATRFREASLAPEVAYVHEGPKGEYLSLDPNALRAELEARDTYKRDLPREIATAIRRKRAAREKAANEEAREIAKHYRRAFAKVADGEEVSL